MALRKRMLMQARERRLAHLAQHFQPELEKLEKDSDAFRRAIRREGTVQAPEHPGPSAEASASSLSLTESRRLEFRRSMK